MDETIREKRIRYMLIVFFIVLTIFAFVFRMNKSQSNHVAEYQTIAVVLKESNHDGENPLIALYHKQFDEHILTYYEIERNNQFHFRARDAVTLRSAPSQMATDKSGLGVWLQIKNRWIYFNEYFKEENNNLENKMNSLGQSVSFQQTRKGSYLYLTVTSGNHVKTELKLQSSHEPTALYSLTKDGTIWLVLFKNDVKIATIRT